MKNIKIIKGKKYLVTGGSGFLGTKLIEEIINGRRQPITAILKEKLSKLTDVERWLTNTGATPGLP